MKTCMYISSSSWPTSVAEATRLERPTMGCVYSLGLSHCVTAQKDNWDRPEVSG